MRKNFCWDVQHIIAREREGKEREGEEGVQQHGNQIENQKSNFWPMNFAGSSSPCSSIDMAATCYNTL